MRFFDGHYEPDNKKLREVYDDAYFQTNEWIDDPVDSGIAAVRDAVIESVAAWVEDQLDRTVADTIRDEWATGKTLND